jgi:hypothetical protein
MQATLTRQPRIAEGESRNKDEPYTTRAINIAPYPKPAFTADKSDYLLCPGILPQTAEASPIQIGADHATITKLRVKDFFSEIRDLLKIDNAYRGVRDMDYLAGEPLERFDGSHADVASKLQAFFGELVELVAEDNAYRGVCRDQRGGCEKCSA